MNFSEPLAAAFIAAPVPGLPASLSNLAYRHQNSTEAQASPMLICIQTSSTNVTRASLRKVEWQVQLVTDPDSTPPTDAPLALEVIEAHMESPTFIAALKAQLSPAKALVSYRTTGMPPIKIDDRIITDTITGTAHIGINAPS